MKRIANIWVKSLSKFSVYVWIFILFFGVMFLSGYLPGILQTLSWIFLFTSFFWFPLLRYLTDKDLKSEIDDSIEVDKKFEEYNIVLEKMRKPDFMTGVKAIDKDREKFKSLINAINLMLDNMQSKNKARVIKKNLAASMNEFFKYSGMESDSIRVNLTNGVNNQENTNLADKQVQKILNSLEVVKNNLARIQNPADNEFLENSSCLEELTNVLSEK